MRNIITQIEALLLAGDQYLRNNMELEALEAYAKVFRMIPWDCTDERQSLLQRAYKGLCILNSSKDEYIWEETSQLLGDYNNREC